jgi:hypothetical protein
MKLKILSLLLLCASCGDNNFPRVEKIEGFRVLGIVATNPEVVAGGSTNVFPYVSDPNGAGRIVSGTYEICRDPGVSFGATPKCEGVTPTTYSINFTTQSDFAANGYTGLASVAVPVAAPASIFTGVDSRQQFNGVAMMVVFRFNVDGKEVTAFRRVVATNRGSLNLNPATPTALLNGGTFVTKPAKGDGLTLNSLNDEETYSYQTVEGSIETRQESYELAWFVTGGELDKAKVSMSERVRFLKSSGSSSFVSVVMVRDERGGVSFRRVYLP